MKKNSKNKPLYSFHCAFTLAESLITVGIVGVVAAIIIPAVMQNVQDYAFAKAKENSLMKIKEATSEMKSNDVLAGYTTNSSFVDEFEKYMTVVKRCDSSNLGGCFATTFKKANGSSLNISTFSSGTGLSPKNIADNTIGLMLKNGTTILFSLRDSTKVGTACDRIDPVNNTSDTTGCMSFLYDINGFKGPNQIGKDIGNINALTCALELGSTCFGSAFTPPTMTQSECLARKSELGIIDCQYNPDYWAGAVSVCGHASKMPTESQMADLANYFLNISTCSESQAVLSTAGCTGTLNYAKAVSLGLPASGSFGIWAVEHGGGRYGYVRDFTSTSSDRSYDHRNKSYKAVCLQ